MLDKKQIIQRFIKYVAVDSQSDPTSEKTPSTDKQWNMAQLLFEELKEIGLQDVEIDKHAYVMATLPSNVSYPVPTIGFIAHFDTSPDFNGKNVNPQIIEDYDGKDIVLNQEKNMVLSPEEFEELLLYKNQTLITTDGTSLLGADDKAGITEIVTAMEYLIQNPSVKHGPIRICFTPDEEIGRGAHLFDVKKFNAEWAYTMDGGQIGQLEYENFNAAEAEVQIQGKSIHPGTAKGRMINSQYIAARFMDALPKLETPEHTDERQGFFHLTQMKGDVNYSVLKYIIRDHDKQHFAARKELLLKIKDQINFELGKELIQLTIKDQYYNMREKIEPVMHIVEIAEEAFKNLNIEPLIQPIRGGTDGSQLSFMGLPCPNIFAGGHNFHGPYEFIPAESMGKATEVIVEIARITAEKSKLGKLPT